MSKGRSNAKTYMKSKPVRFEIRLYVNFGYHPPRLHTFVGSGCGNETGSSHTVLYVSVFSSLRGSCKVRRDRNLLLEASASA